MNAPFVKLLSLYPIKACGGIDLETAYVSERGLMAGKILDRSWVIIDENDVLVSQRGGNAKLARVKVELVMNANGIADKIRASVEGMPDLLLDPALVGDVKQRAIIHGGETTGHLASPEINQWFSDYLGKPVRLVHQKKEDVRLCSPHYAITPSDTVSYADGYQILIVNPASTDDDITRFRANLVAGNMARDSEYGIRQLSGGEATLRIVKPCDRCEVTAIDPKLGVVTNINPLTALARRTYLRQAFKSTNVANKVVNIAGTIFGENANVVKPGMISVNDPIIIDEMKTPETMYKFMVPRARAVSPT